MSAGRKIALVLVASLFVAGAVAGLGIVALKAIGPLSDEWVCADGEVPAGPAPVEPGTAVSGCYTDETMPAGFEADPFGNRPMPYNCDKHGWVLVEKNDGSSRSRECVSDETAKSLPDGWRVAGG